MTNKKAAPLLRYSPSLAPYQTQVHRKVTRPHEDHSQRLRKYGRGSAKARLIPSRTESAVGLTVRCHVDGLAATLLSRGIMRTQQRHHMMDPMFVSPTSPLHPVPVKQANPPPRTRQRDTKWASCCRRMRDGASDPAGGPPGLAERREATPRQLTTCRFETLPDFTKCYTIHTPNRSRERAKGRL